jgi:hypothetical protein
MMNIFPPASSPNPEAGGKDAWSGVRGGIGNLCCDAAPWCDPPDRRFFLAKGRAKRQATMMSGKPPFAEMGNWTR